MLERIKALIESATSEGGLDIQGLLDLIRDILDIIFGKVAEGEGWDNNDSNVELI